MLLYLEDWFSLMLGFIYGPRVQLEIIWDLDSHLDEINDKWVLIIRENTLSLF